MWDGVLISFGGNRYSRAAYYSSESSVMIRFPCITAEDLRSRENRQRERG